MSKVEIPIFFSIDDNYIPFLAVALRSLIDNASKAYDYKIEVLNSGLKPENMEAIKSFETENVKVEFADVNEKIKEISSDLSLRLRDYYSNSIYYRIFIPSLFPHYKKALYLDADITIIDDISKLYFEDVGDNLLGVITDDVVFGDELLEKYAKDALGIEKGQYFNSGILVMNLEKLREEKIEDKFVHLLSKYNFDTIAPDQDYLNVLCKGKVKYLSNGWDRMPCARAELDDSELKLIHYNMFEKPWHYSNVKYEEHFWKYAEKTPYYDEIATMKASYTPEQMNHDKVAGDAMMARAEEIINADVTFKNTVHPNYFENFN
ncbi:MAG: glycosyltransferase family 8 protein [Clostridia bacterium]|nr:glycosyltransferase family 8 protein [Clostridia bacterium]